MRTVTAVQAISFKNFFVLLNVLAQSEPYIRSAKRCKVRSWIRTELSPGPNYFRNVTQSIQTNHSKIKTTNFVPSYRNQSCLTFHIFKPSRYITMCRPFFRQQRVLKARVFIIPIILFALVYNVPRFFELSTGEPLIEPQLNRTKIINQDAVTCL